MSYKTSFTSAAAVALCLSFAGDAVATVYVPSYGSSGPQSYSYTFPVEWSGKVVIGVSDEGDNAVGSFLTLSKFGGVLKNWPDYSLSTNPASPVSTYGYMNTKGENGTDGEIVMTDYQTFNPSDSISFDWVFKTNDYSPYNDFAFISFEGAGGYQSFYTVLAEIADGNNVPIPGTLSLLGLGLLGLGMMGLGRKCQAVNKLK